MNGVGCTTSHILNWNIIERRKMTLALFELWYSYIYICQWTGWVWIWIMPFRIINPISYAYQYDSCHRDCHCCRPHICYARVCHWPQGNDTDYAMSNEETFNCHSTTYFRVGCICLWKCTLHAYRHMPTNMGTKGRLKTLCIVIGL